MDVRRVPVYQCVWRDITERKRAEEELRDSEEMNRRLIESLTDAILVRGRELVTFANPAALRLFRAAAMEELVGRRYLDLIHPDDRAVSAERVRRNMEEGWAAPPREHRIIALDGAVVDVESTGVLFKHRGGAHVFGVFRDISARKQADLEKAKLETQLRQAQKMEAIGTLAGGIAHDFNNILSVIIGNAEMLGMSEEISPSTSRENVAPILAASSRAKKLVSQILTFSRQGEQQKLLISLKPVIKETIEFLRSSLPSTIQLKQYINPQAGTILADPTQMQQVLMNLCTNAAHAMEGSAGELKIELENATITEADSRMTADVEPGSYVKMSVSDTGHGMEARVRERIFDPYFTTKGPGKGTGLGLSVVHGIVKSHGGMIQVYSEPGAGTTFRVYFPRTDGLERDEARIPEPLPRGTEKVLMVDDEPELADLGKRMLAHLGYRVDVRTSPLEALELFRADPERFDAIITDMTMPHLTGLNLAREILAIRPTLPIILCTGFSEQADEAKSHSAGVHSLLFKPLVISELANALRTALDETKAEDPQ
jgi:PAS domain S-box-containing protein